MFFDVCVVCVVGCVNSVCCLMCEQGVGNAGIQRIGRKVKSEGAPAACFDFYL